MSSTRRSLLLRLAPDNTHCQLIRCPPTHLQLGLISIFHYIDTPTMTSVVSAKNASEGEQSGQDKKKKGVFKALKFELQQVKNRWNDEIKLMWTRPPPPGLCGPCESFHNQKTLACDVDELRLRLIITGPDMENFPLDVEVAQKSLPKELQSAISEAIKKYWKEELAPN